MTASFPLGSFTVVYSSRILKCDGFESACESIRSPHHSDGHICRFERQQLLIKLTLPSTQKTVVAVCVSSKHFYSKSPLHKFMSSLIDRRVKYKTLLVRCRNEKKHNNDMQCTGTCAQSQTSLHAETYLEGVYHRGP